MNRKAHGSEESANRNAGETRQVTKRGEFNKIVGLGPALEPFVKEHDEHTHYGDDTENDKGHSKGVHFETSMPSSA